MEGSKTEATGQEAPQGVERSDEESRREGESPVQVAPEGLIVLDVGVLMGSRSPQVLDEMIALYPGAKVVMDQIIAKKCGCDNPMCQYDAFQMILANIALDDKEVAAKFLSDVEEKKAQITTPEELRDFFLQYRHDVHKASWVADILRDFSPTSFN